MEAKYTAGPWTAPSSNMGGAHNAKCPIYAHGEVIGYMQQGYRYEGATQGAIGLGNAHANATLAAAAPDLAEGHVGTAERLEMLANEPGLSDTMQAELRHEARICRELAARAGVTP